MQLEMIDEGIVWKNSYPSMRSVYCWHGHTLNLGGGELIHMAVMGQAKMSHDTKCAVLRSTDNGKTWSVPKPFVRDEDLDPAYSYLIGLPSQTRDGRVWASSMRFDLAEPEDPRWTPGNSGWMYCENFLCHSTDKGHTWSKPQFVRPHEPEDGFPTIASPVHELADGRLMLVFEVFPRRTLKELWHQVFTVYSSDGGQTWGDQTLLVQDPEKKLIYFDPRLAQLPDGRWMALFWTHDRQTDEALNTTIAYSEDGVRWSKPTPTELWGFPSLPLVLPDGRLFAVYNYRRIPQGIRCAVSNDQGQTWDMANEYLLWDQGVRRATGELVSSGQKREWSQSCFAEMFTWDFGVPHPTLLDDGTIHITFYATQMDHITHQRYVRIRMH